MAQQRLPVRKIREVLRLKAAGLSDRKIAAPLVQIPVRVNAAAFISQSVPGTMVANQSSAVTVTMRNDGYHTWNVGDYYLASNNPPNNSAFGLNRIELPGPVGTGQQVTFSFNAVPPSGGTKNFQWRIVDSIEGAFGSASTNVAVAVSGTDSSQYVSQSVPGAMTAGQSYAVSVTLANNGNTTWSAADGFKLAPHPLPDNNTWGITRVNLPAPVAPGQQVTIPFNVSAPTLTGVYSFQWRMIHEGIGAFGAASANVGFPIGAISTEVLFIHVDYLNTPRLVADDQQRTVWRWDQIEPFGANVPDENPSGLGAFPFNLRLPGQYFDKETGLAYNYFRDYDSNIGRYVQSDPIGLEGGLSTYSYVDANPLSFIDRDGLFVTSAQAACAVNPIFCAEIMGQIVENTSMITDGCLTEEAEDAIAAMKNVAMAAAIFGGVKNVANAFAARNALRFAFGQRSVKNTFSGGPYAGQTIGQVAKGLKAGTISPHTLPIDYVIRNGQAVVLNNRSYLALRRAGMQPTVVRDLTNSPAAQRLLDRHLAGGSPSTVIRVRGGSRASSLLD